MELRVLLAAQVSAANCALCPISGGYVSFRYPVQLDHVPKGYSWQTVCNHPAVIETHVAFNYRVTHLLAEEVMLTSILTHTEVILRRN